MLYSPLATLICTDNEYDEFASSVLNLDQMVLHYILRWIFPHTPEIDICELLQ
jgi:hypothetical protein